MTNEEKCSEFVEEIYINYRKPQGEHAVDVLHDMNKSHEKLATWATSHLQLDGNELILDIGCGGGANIKRFSSMTKNKVFGLDYSSKSVEESIKFNQEAVDAGNVEVLEGSVSDIPFEDGVFDLVTAFETTYFWPDLENDLKEIHRVLKDDGQILIAVTDTADKEFGEKMLKAIDFLEMNLPTNDEMIKTLESAGFTKISLFIKDIDDYSCYIARK